MKLIIPASTLLLGLMTSVVAPPVAANPNTSAAALIAERRAQALSAESQGDFNRAMALSRALASAGDASSMRRLGQLLLKTGDGQAKRLAAAYWLQRAALAGENAAENDLQHASRSDHPYDLDALADALWQAAAKGDPEAQYQLATLLEAIGPHQNTVEAAKWLERADAQGHRKAARRMTVRRLRAAAMAKARGEAEPSQPAATVPLSAAVANGQNGEGASNLETSALPPALNAPEDGTQPAVAQVQAMASVDTETASPTAQLDTAPAIARPSPRPRAEQLYRLGRAQFDGTRTPDRALAFALWREAARLGHARAATAAANLAAALTDAELSRAEEASRNLATAAAN